MNCDPLAIQGGISIFVLIDRGISLVVTLGDHK